MIQDQPPFPLYTSHHPEDPNAHTISYVKFKYNLFFSIIAAVDSFEINFMCLTTIFIAIYVGVSAVLAAKVIYASFVGYTLISCLQMLYSGPRP